MSGTVRPGILSSPSNEINGKHMSKYVIGLDFGTDSVRALVVDSSDGTNVSSAVAAYERWGRGLYCDPASNRYRQHPLDYLDSMRRCVVEAVGAAEGIDPKDIIGISVDTTASTPVIVASNGMPLCLFKRFSDNPDAMFVLWKDHTSVGEADRINEVCSGWPVDYRKYTGGIYSSEWAWAKVLHCLKHSPEIAEAAFSWVEECDWISGVLAGDTDPLHMSRSRCAAGHKALWCSEWGGLPPWDFLEEVDPALSVFRDHMYSDTCPAGTRIGGLCREWADILGLPEGIAIGAGSVDCHVGAVGAGIRQGVSVKVMGTSTCDICVETPAADGRVVRGICGQVSDSVVPGMTGFEAGQAAFGDVYAWISRFTGLSIKDLSDQAALLPLTGGDMVALDWFNGRRTPDEDSRVTACIDGLTLSATPAHVFKALVEATAFGSRAIRERYVQAGIDMSRLIAVGGVSRKSPYVMQTLCDVLGITIDVLDSDHACALGAAMAAAVAAGVHPDVPSAQSAMAAGISATYLPDMGRHAVYDILYRKYQKLANGKYQ